MTKQDRTFIGFLVGIALVGSFAAGASSSLAQARNAPSPPSLCKAGERVLFQCPIGRRMASVCENTASRTAQYRFGQRGKIEFTYPTSGRGGLTWAQAGYSGGGELQINFRNGAYHYVLYSRTVRTKSESGVAVLRGNKLLSDRRCNNPDKEAFVEDVENLMPRGELSMW